MYHFNNTGIISMTLSTITSKSPMDKIQVKFSISFSIKRQLFT